MIAGTHNKRVDGQPLPCFLVPMRSPAESLEVVQATPADVGEVVPLFDAYRQFYKKPSDLEAARRFLFARLSKGESVLFVAHHDGRAVGFVHLYPVFSSVNLTRQWILNDLYVVADARKQGIGRALMNACSSVGRGHASRQPDLGNRDRQSCFATTVRKFGLEARRGVLSLLFAVVIVITATDFSR